MEARDYVSFGNSEQKFMKYTVNFIYNGTLLFIAYLNKISTFKCEKGTFIEVDKLTNVDMLQVN